MLILWRNNDYFATLQILCCESKHSKTHVRRYTACIKHFSNNIDYRYLKNHQKVTIICVLEFKLRGGAVGPEKIIFCLGFG